MVATEQLVDMAVAVVLHGRLEEAVAIPVGVGLGLPALDLTEVAVAVVVHTTMVQINLIQTAFEQGTDW